MTEFEMCMAALSRPANYAKLHPESQWSIDKSLGILDWNGINLDKARACIEAEDAGRAVAEFKMSLDNLKQVVRGFDLRHGRSEG